MTLSYCVKDLRSGFKHQFKVQSVNALGTSEISASSLSILTALLPSVPTGLTLVRRNTTSMTFDWDAPEMKGGVELISYKIYMALNGGVYSPIQNLPSTTSPSVTVQT